MNDKKTFFGFIVFLLIVAGIILFFSDGTLDEAEVEVSVDGIDAMELNYQDIDLQSVLNQDIYDDVCDVFIPLFDGKTTEDKYPCGESGEPSPFNISLTNVGIMDLGNDGIDEAYYIERKNTGGSGTFVSLIVSRRLDGLITELDRVELGDRVQINRIEVDGAENRNLTILYTGHGPDDPACCPTINSVYLYFLNDEGKLEIPNIQ